MRLQVLELDHVSEITQEVAAEVCREGLKGLGDLVLTATPVTPRPCCISTVSDGEQGWGATVNSYRVLSAGSIANSLLLLVSKRLTPTLGSRLTRVLTPWLCHGAF